MMSEAYKQFIVFTILFILSYSAAKINMFATILSIFIPAYILCRPTADIDMNPFRYWKGPSVLIPLLIFANFYLLPKSIHKYAYLFTYILMFNMLQPIFLIQLKDSEIMSKLNAILLLVLALYTPKLHYNESRSIISFKDKHNISWIIASCLVLGGLYIFSDYYKRAEWQYIGLYGIIIPTLVSLIGQDTILWPSLRAYALPLSFLVLFDPIKSMYIQTTKKLVTNYDLSHDKYDSARAMLLCLSSIATAYVVKNGTKNTVIDYLFP